MRGSHKFLISVLALLAFLLLLAGTGLAQPIQNSIGGTAQEKSTQYTNQSNWSFAFDNDILVPGSRDQDYTYGLNMTLTGEAATQPWTFLHAPRIWVDNRLGLNGALRQQKVSNRIEFGLFGFTPEDITLAEPAEGDRPYASLVYAVSSRERYDPKHQVSWVSSLTLGMLGLGIVGDLQDSLHANINGDRPRGWHSQISAGGEPTARFSVSRQRLLLKSPKGFEIKSTWLGSVGFITEASWSLNLRAGKIQSPWISFNPELTSYGEKSVSSQLGRVSEHYVSMGFSLKARAYNAFLQGQFKDNEFSYNSDQLNHGVIEAWVGYNFALNKGFSFSYLLRGHTSELKQGVGDRNVIWGSVRIEKNFS